jgi:hypothetical protein
MSGIITRAALQMPSAISLRTAVMLFAIGFVAISWWRMAGMAKARDEALQRIGQEQARADQLRSALEAQSAGLMALAESTKKTQAAVAANGNAAQAAMLEIARRVSLLGATADELATRLPGPPETACARAAIELRDTKGMAYVSINLVP